MFLTAEELRELTGYIYCSRQIDWLRRRNWKFEMTAQMRPKVARSYFEARLGVSSATPKVDAITPVDHPNFQFLNKARFRKS